MTQTVTQPVAVQADYQRIPGNKAVATVQGAQPSGNGTGPAGEATWGYIIGSIDNQADLIARLDAKVDLVTYQAAVPPHIANTNNPHQVTKSQVGLDQVDNTSDANKPVSGPQKIYIDDGDAAANANANNRVLKAGDTMTGSLNFSKSTTVGIGIATSDSPYINLQKGASGKASTIAGLTGANLRWQMHLGDTAAESGTNAGSNFNLFRYTDAGALIAPALSVLRRNGYVMVGPGTQRAGAFTDAPGAASIEMSRSVGSSNQIVGSTDGSLRWVQRLGNTTAEGGSNAGSDYTISRYDDAGALLGQAMMIVRKNGYAVLGPGTPRAATLSDATSGYAVLELNNSGSGQGNFILGDTNGSLRWSMELGSTAAESGSNIGSNFSLERFSDAGSPLGKTLQINRRNGAATFGPGGMSGTAAVANEASIEISKSAAAASAFIAGTNNGLRRWTVNLGNSEAESGGNAGSKFTIGRYSDAGAFIDAPFSINRQTGSIELLSNNASYSLAVQNAFVEGPNFRVNFLWANPAWNPCTMEAFHETGVWAGWRFMLNGGASGEFRLMSDGWGRSTAGWTTISDARKKTNLQQLECLAICDEAEVFEFDRLDAHNMDGTPVHQVGVMAQTLEKHCRSLVHQSKPTSEDPEPMRAVDYGGLAAVAYGGVRAVHAKVKSAEARIADLESKLSAALDRIAQLEGA